MFTLGAASRKNLEGVHPSLVKVVERAIQITSQDFGVHDGLRTRAEQEAYVAAGVSKTMKSRHLAHVDGQSWAVDLVPYVNGKLRWEWPPIFPIAAAMRSAALETGFRLTWGGVWDRHLNDLGGTPSMLKGAVDAYKVRHPGSDFLDGPHFELV